MRERTQGPRSAVRGGPLERAIGFALTAVQPVVPRMLLRPTPCEFWDLGMLVLHLGESLAALHEGMRRGHVAAVPPQAEPVDDPVSALRVQAIRLLKASAVQPVVTVGDRRLAGGLMAAAGALEVAVHGWDISQATGERRRIPPPLAEELLALCPLVVPEPRHPLFADAVEPEPHAGSGDRLVALLGRRRLG